MFLRGLLLVIASMGAASQLDGRGSWLTAGVCVIGLVMCSVAFISNGGRFRPAPARARRRRRR